eukprot:9118209-Pyramimonas_sp.AAC.1
MTQVALQVLAAAVPERATGRWRTARRWEYSHSMSCQTRPHSGPKSMIHVIPLQAVSYTHLTLPTILLV